MTNELVTFEQRLAAVQLGIRSTSFSALVLAECILRVAETDAQSKRRGVSRTCGLFCHSESEGA